MLLSDGRSVPVAPQALAELVPLTQTGYYYPEAVGLELERRFAMYGQLYAQQPWVRAVVDKRANSVARVSINVWDESPANGKVLDQSGPYAKLMSKPCQFLDTFTFWFWLVAMIDVFGEAYLVKARGVGGRPVGLIPMHPSRVAIKRAPDTGAYVYTFQLGPGAGDGLMTYDEQDVIPFRLFNPNKLERGLSRLEALRSTLLAEDSSRTAVSSMWRNAGRPNMVLSTDKKLSRDAKLRLRESWDAMYAGSDNAGNTAVLEEGMSAIQMQMNAVDMEFVQARQLNREEVCGVFDMPPPVVQILDHATFSNITEQMRSLYRDSMAPLIEFIESTLDAYLGVEFNGQKFARFAVGEILRGDIETRATTAIALVANGIMKPAEARPWFDLNDAGPIADKLYANSAIQELGKPTEQIRLTGAVENDPDGIAVDPLAALPAAGGGTSVPSTQPGKPPTAVPALTSSTPSAPMPKHYRSLMGAVSRGKSLEHAARDIYAKHPDDAEEILASVRLAIERTRNA
ncbi:phage portal protein [Rhodococcus sp. D2-41]|uniref:Phage portal protein n=1 Tax=Speluncibacter jeojiensis TaxID=2710754 RepID=A0A9X4LY93_9ACTN|nr:phage portal protein [Rhodococcus sp. D2-41]MDG3012383.1 phage portal protein [Rhodococcus sp. D2-41]MDG3013555.1 phage portal protein [Corynebacteriales bacterium D3-21]